MRNDSRNINREQSYRTPRYGRTAPRHQRWTQGFSDPYGETRQGRGQSNPGPVGNLDYENYYGAPYGQEEDTSRHYGSSGSPYGVYGRESEYSEFENRPRSSHGSITFGHRSGDLSESRGTSYAGRGPKGYKRTDERIQEKVCEMLTRDDEVDAENIEVEVKDGEVTLSGTVPERRMKHRAEDCVEKCFGVVDINNQLRVKKEESFSEETRRSTSTNTPSSSQSYSGSGRRNLNS